MLRLTRLPPGQRALLPHPKPLTFSTTTTLQARLITFVTGKKRSTYRPVTFLGPGGNFWPTKVTPRAPWRWSPSTISTLAAGSLLGGSWIIWKEGRSYKVADEVDRYEPRVLGTHREGKVNRDYVNYDQWVERHRQQKQQRKQKRK
ncbi:uncharacterized protein THITE_42262 [Thermothielavioides terrestris NRRL 8126]|uniref:Uncharacterized protein n=2 Tax=Thermothielavioides terrestris TaxID=2587410 RepID=G2R9Q1_THETT|nr:uncharacterized protein THITE_42262 [Thermothielavioides terrestris NRRL 8126]AEO68739.1 hypothetical protein THITE_42262 [Thermothielavioides terrestris NRRL 8126]